MGIMQSLRKKDRRVEAEGVPPKAAEATPLMMLVPDAQGIATYQLHKFPSARAAEIFVDATLRGQVNHGTVLFWALTWQPDSEAAAEPLVLIRDLARPIVYLFSFADLSSCHDFIRHEMNRGLDLNQVMVYWAVTATVEVDFWGRAAISPSAAPRLALTPTRSVAKAPEPIVAERGSEARGAIVPFTSRDNSARADEPRYLTEADIAEAIRRMNELTAEPEGTTESAPVIDFPSASKKLSQSKNAKASVAAWANFALALDGALDVYAAQQVRIRLSWNRLTRGLADAASASTNRHGKMRRTWINASVALSDGAMVAIRRKLMRKVWMNTAWTLEEAGYAQRLEKTERAIRGWHNAAASIAQAHDAYLDRSQTAATVWATASREIAAAVELHQRLLRVRVGLNFASVALEEVIEANAYRDEIVAAWDVLAVELARAAESQLAHKRAVAAWNNAARAFDGARKASARQQKRSIKAWTRIAQAIKTALAAEAKLRKLEGKTMKINDRSARNETGETVDAPYTAESEVTTSDNEQIVALVTKQDSEESAGEEPTPATTRIRRAWEQHDEPFSGFRSPPGRF